MSQHIDPRSTDGGPAEDVRGRDRGVVDRSASAADRHRREAAEDRSEAAAERRRGHDVRAAGNELEAKSHDVAARLHGGPARGEAGRPRQESGEGWRAEEGVTPPPPPDVTPPPEPHGMGAAQGGAAVIDGVGLLGDEHGRRFRARWDEIQGSFVDEPRQAVGEADKLVREATEALHECFERDRRQLEGIWDRGEEVTTEDLRVTLQRYRSFFERLLAI
jgi:hypothetical protein